MHIRLLFILVLICAFASSCTHKKYDKYLLKICFIALFVVMAFRGGFSTDYRTYVSYFLEIPFHTLKDILTMDYHLGYIESGFALIIKAINIFSNNYLWMFIICSLIILVPTYRLIEESDNKWLSLILYLSFNTYFNSFNLLRSFMAVSILTLAIKAVVNRHFKEYVCWVVLASTIHVSALFLIPVYFLLNLDVSEKSILIYGGIAISLLVLLKPLSTFYLKLIYKGIFVDSLSGLRFKDIIVQLAFFLFVTVVCLLSTSMNIKVPNDRDKVLINGTMLWGIFLVATLQIGLAQRFVYYFEPFAIICIPTVIRYYFNDRDCRLINAVCIALLILYFLVWQGNYLDSLYTFTDHPLF